jgi:hypothetical protein
MNNEDRYPVPISEKLQAGHGRVVGFVPVHVSVDEAAHLGEHVHNDETAVRVLA